MSSFSEFNGLLWLSAYIFMNLFTTVLNKMLLQTYDIPFPSSMSLWHYLCSALGAVFAVKVMRVTEPTPLTMADQVRLFLFSILFNINILISTVSLYLVSMALHQIVRALVPAMTVAIMFCWQGKHYPLHIHLSIMTIFLGVTIYACKGELDYTLYGISLTLFGAFLAALKTVATNVFLVGPLKMHPLELLQYMCLYASLQMLPILLYTGTLQDTIAHLSAHADNNIYTLIAVNGLGAFLLNVVSFVTNKKTSPLAMNIGAIAKQIIAIVFGLVWFSTPVTNMSIVGVVVTCVGIAWYTFASFKDRRKPAAACVEVASDGKEKEKEKEKTTQRVNV